MADHRTYCRLCPALCGIVVTTDGDRVLDVVGDRGHPLSEGYTCPKGRSLPQLHHHPERLERPTLRRGAGRHEVSWDTSLDDMAATLRRIIAESGPDAVGMYVGTGSAFDGAGRSTTRRFMRAIGSPAYYTSGSVDAPCKPLVAEMVAGSASLLPHVGPDTRLTLLVGINPVVSHGHLQAFPNPRRRLKRLRDQGELWVADPRRTETAEIATRHLAPRPGTDPFWLAAVVRELLGSADFEELATRATGVARLVTAVAPWTIPAAAARCEVPEADLHDLVAAIRRAGRIGIESGTGMTMTAGANVAQWLLWAICIITDSFDHPEGMWFNPGFLHSFDRANLVAVEGAGRPGPASRPDVPERFGEYPAAALSDEIEGGNLRALFVFGGNLMTALPDAPRVGKALESIELLAVGDVRRTATTDLATHVLPVHGQLERADLPWLDTITPAIAVQYTPRVVAPVGERMEAWRILGHLARRLGEDALHGADPDTAVDDDILRLMTRRSRAPFELIQTGDVLIDDDVPFGWARAVLPKGGWRIAPQPLVDQLAALPAAEPGLVLSPSRQLRHLNSLFAGEAVQDGRTELPDLTMHPDDAAARGIDEGQLVSLTTATGRVEGRAALKDSIRRGAVTLPHGYDDVNVNDLTSSVDLDALTGMPLYAAIPVAVAPV